MYRSVNLVNHVCCRSLPVALVLSQLPGTVPGAKPNLMIKHMFMQFNFDPQGVVDWQAALAASTSEVRAAEADLAARGLIYFLPERFLLDED